MAGCRMAMKGRPLIKQGYEQELSSIKAFVSMQNKSESSSSLTDHVSGSGFIGGCGYIIVLVRMN